MEKLLFLYNKVIPPKSIIYINILVLSVSYSHFYKYSCIISGRFCGSRSGIYVFIQSLCCSNDWWWFNISLCKYLQWLLCIYNKIKIFILKMLSMIVQHVWWRWNKNQIFVKQYGLFFLLPIQKTFKKYFCIKCTLDAKEEIWSTTQWIYCVFLLETLFRWRCALGLIWFYLWSILKQPGWTKAAQLESKTA